MPSDTQHPSLAAQAGLLWTWWRHDPLPTLPPLPTFSVEQTEDVQRISRFTRMSHQDITGRFEEGHRVYIASLGTTPVAYGWSAINNAAFGSPSVFFRVPEKNRYLYHFITLLRWRGLGIYPHLLQAIMRDEETERFWIIHQQTNTASRRGIAKAGFRIANKVFFLSTGQLGLIADQELDRAREGAQLLGLPLLTD